MAITQQKLILISYDFPPATGGIARLCYEIAMGMHVYYESVTVLTLQKKGTAIPYADKNFQVVSFSPKRLKAEWQIVRFLKQLKHKEQYHVICGLWHPDATLAVLAGMPNVYILAHGTELLYGKSAFRKYIWHPICAKWVLGKAKKVIANSRYTAGLVNNINPKAWVTALPLAVNQQYFKPLPVQKNPNQFVISTVSRILQFKGHDFILETLSALPEPLREKVTWQIAGTGPYLEMLKVKVASSALAGQVVFHGFVPDKELPKFYNQSDVFILATREAPISTQVEGFGLVFLEAQSCGIPVIGADTGGISDAVHPGAGGWLIQQDHVQELLQLLTVLIKHPEKVQEEGERARKRVLETATWQQYNQKLFEIVSHS